MPRSDSRRAGFTLIEVLAAVLIVSLVFGILLQAVTRNLADLARARAEARAAQLAEDRIRDLKMAVESGEPLEDGVKEGVFDAPDDDMRWQIRVTPQTLALPADYRGELPPSPLFAAGNEPPPAPKPGEEPPLRLVEVRVYPPDTDPEGVEPFVVLVTAPADAASLQQLQQQQQPQQPGAGTNPTGAGAPANPMQSGSRAGQN